MQKAVTERLPKLSPVDRSSFLDAMSSGVSGVSIMTTNEVAGRLGITLSSVTSLSADPPMLLACVNQKSPVCDALRRNTAFSINFLSGSQRKLADIFAGRPIDGSPYDFDRFEWIEGCNGSPLLVSAVSTFECQLVKSVNAASHIIFVGLVIEAITNGGKPLLYSGRAYGVPAHLDELNPNKS